MSLKTLQVKKFDFAIRNGWFQTLSGSGWLRLIPDTRWLWLALAGSRHKVALAGSGWLWLILAGSGWFWLALGNSMK